MSRRAHPGQQLPNGVVVTKQADGGMRRIRCPSCQGLATPMSDVKGKTVLQCGSCGRQWTSQKI